MHDGSGLCGRYLQQLPLGALRCKTGHVTTHEAREKQHRLAHFDMSSRAPRPVKDRRKLQHLIHAASQNLSYLKLSVADAHELFTARNCCMCVIVSDLAQNEYECRSL